MAHDDQVRTDCNLSCCDVDVTDSLIQSRMNEGPSKIQMVVTKPAKTMASPLRLSLLFLFLTLAVGAKTKPNVVLLFADDLGYGDLGFNGHPTSKTPNLDRLAWNGKILTTWYSGCNICTGSRAALLTGRQFPRTGLPGVLGPVGDIGLNLNETTIAEQLKQAGYSTAIVGKWHLGQRQVYLPGNHGFDYYLGIPYSDDMGDGVASACPVDVEVEARRMQAGETPSASWSKEQYEELGFLQSSTASVEGLGKDSGDDPAGKHLPLVYQKSNHTQILEQPLDFTTLAQKYNSFALNFLDTHKDEPFFLYMPFSHVHTTSGTQPEKQYAGCRHKGSTRRGIFGDALAETDWIVGNIVDKLKALGLEEDTLVLFTSDNGPWLEQANSGGSEGLFTGRYSGYWSTGKGSNWEGGIREPAFAYWKGTIEPFTRSAEIISSMDVFPTLSKLAGIDLPNDRVYDGRDMTEVLLNESGESKHDFLFFYGTCTGAPYWSISAVRHGPYKAHWCTRPGLGQRTKKYHNLTKLYDPPLMFNVERDPSESAPVNDENEQPDDPEDLAAMQRILKAYAMEKATFEFGSVVPIPDGPGEGPDEYGLCCDRSKDCYCTPLQDQNVGILNLGTKTHHDKYHDALGEQEPMPPRTRAQKVLQEMGI